ncbi:aspartate/glutamate racemase family protein [Segetibacter aerophilus]|uniref:Aspartate racemase n=1 Tax=Segetibacter aerophilus TaxID=670293 RepID=A0A512B9R5_9BACT|nr:amino acid racemase [Segetibacter aerophilus]GEO08683.1 aspartate racemase [Segetibacter aerophilus]
MKTIGLIGGTSWVSTIDYYKLINQLTNEKLGGSNAARIILYSVNFQEFKNLMDIDNWNEIAARFSDIARKLEGAGAECIVICANTPHLIADVVEQAVKLPLIHIAEETAKEIETRKVKKVALLGTRFVMDKPFFKDKLALGGIRTILPREADKEFIHNSIFTELTRDIFTEETKEKYLQIIEDVIQEGAEGIIYACTEIPILLKGCKVKVETFDTTVIHAKAAVAFACAE